MKRKANYGSITYYSFLFYFVIPVLLLGQSPGGFDSNVELWLKADRPQEGGVGSLEDNQTVDLWKDVSGNGRDHKKFNNLLPVYKKTGDLMNFQPSMYFAPRSRAFLAGPDLKISANKAYYVFYVSKLEKTTGISYVYTLNATRNNYSGWYTGIPYFTTAGATYRSKISQGKNYGIVGIIRPNSTTLTQMLYFNSIPENTLRSYSIRLGDGQSLVGASATTSANSFEGDIQEIIVLSAPQNTYLTDMDLQRIHSYLSVKYGISLESADEISFPSYVNSKGEKIWDGENFMSYQNHVFGLGRDDQYGLYQKQSTNYDLSTLTAYVGDELTELNDNNNGTLTNNTFLMFGSNDEIGVERYEHLQGEKYSNSILSEDIFFKLKRTLKTKVTGTKSLTVNMKLNVDAKYVIVSSVETFDPSKTRIYPVNDGIVKGVEIENEDYVSFTSGRPNPGGVNLLTELWLRADDIPSTEEDSTEISTWQDISVYKRDHSVITDAKEFKGPIIRNQKGLMNYHSHLQFTNTGQSNSTIPVLTAPSFYSSDKSYYIFYVSEINTSGLSVLYALNSNNSNTNNDNNQGWNLGNPALTNGYNPTNTVQTHSNSINKTYGVVAVERTNDKYVAQRIIFNGISNSFNGFAMENKIPALSLIGARQLYTKTLNYFNPFVGNVQEIIVLSGNKGTPIDSKDFNRINSYLAIKYGITLHSESEPDYYDSYGNKVWDGKINAGFNHDIFGIARDDSSDLYQKQSVSYDRDLMTIFVGNEVADMNKLGNGTLKNKDYLMLGSNGLEDYLLDYNYLEGTAYANGKLPFRIDYRNQVTLKAQTSGSDSYVVNIQPSLTAKILLVSPDGKFEPQNTRFYVVENKVAKNVEINDGDYISYALYGFAPGGVLNGLRLWLKADDKNSLVFDGESSNLLIWKDQTVNENDYYFSLVDNKYKVAPVYDSCNSKMNFFPSIYFSQNSALAIKKGPMSTNAPEHSTSFIIYNSFASPSTVRTYTHGFGGLDPVTVKTRHPAVGFSPNYGTGRIATSIAITQGTVKGFEFGATALHMTRLSKAYKGIDPKFPLIEHDFGGIVDTLSRPESNFGSDFLMASGGTIGAASLNSGLFDGLISELFFYERKLSKNEKVRIQTYLAMKYAITLYTTKYIIKDKETEILQKQPTDYILSDIKTKVWKGSTQPYSNYHRNIAGLVRDDNSNIFVNKARSTDVQSIVTIQAGESTECGQGQKSVLKNDLSGLFWGHNGDTGTTDLSELSQSICGGLDRRMNRIWLVNKTNLDEQSVILSADESSEEFFFNQNYRVYLLIANSDDDIKNENWAYTIPGEWVDNKVQFNYKFTEDTTYFTFGAVKSDGVCTNCSFSGYKTIDLPQIWKGAANNGQLDKTVDLGDDFSANINISDPGKVLRYKYPRRSGKTLQFYRYGNFDKDKDPITTTISFTGGAAAAMFEIFDIDTQAYRSDEINVYGICGGGIVKPKLMHVAPKKKSSYTIDKNIAIAKATGGYRSSGYTAARGKVLVDFSVAVEKIVIEYKVHYNRRPATGSQMIGIGAIKLYCPKPVEVNEDGLAFTLKVAESTLTCEEVPFIFKIMNTNCESKLIDLTDQLPQGMQWVKESLNIEDGEFTTATKEYGDSDLLSIKGIKVPGGTTTIVTARAKFTEDKTASYFTRASIQYLNRNDENVTYESCDVIDGCGNTTVNAVAAGLPSPVIISDLRVDKTCIAEDETILVTMDINNPNSLLDNVTLNASFSEGFKYVKGSLTTSFKMTDGTINTEDIEDNEFEIEDFSLPNGNHTLSFKIKAPEILPNNFTEMEINIDMTTSSEIDCASIDIDGNNFVLVSFCTPVPFCTLDPNLEPSTEVSKIGITTLEKELKGWPFNIYNGFIVLESKNKGFVITRTSSDLIPQEKLVEGMVIYDTTDKCIKLYNGEEWHCIERTCPQ